MNLNNGFFLYNFVYNVSSSILDLQTFESAAMAKGYNRKKDEEDNKCELFLLHELHPSAVCINLSYVQLKTITNLLLSDHVCI